MQDKVNEISPELREKVKACKTPEEVLHIAKKRGAYYHSTNWLSYPEAGIVPTTVVTDEATRREPIIREFVDEPRWRTEADGLPFTGTKFAAIFGTMPLDPGNETANPADIPLLVDEIVSFAAREDLPPELVACGMPYLVFRIHPFKDGNGHVLRMLT